MACSKATHSHPPGLTLSGPIGRACHAAMPPSHSQREVHHSQMPPRYQVKKRRGPWGHTEKSGRRCGEQGCFFLFGKQKKSVKLTKKICKDGGGISTRLFCNLGCQARCSDWILVTCHRVHATAVQQLIYSFTHHLALTVWSVRL